MGGAVAVGSKAARSDPYDGAPAGISRRGRLSRTAYVPPFTFALPHFAVQALTAAVHSHIAAPRASQAGCSGR